MSLYEQLEWDDHVHDDDGSGWCTGCVHRDIARVVGAAAASPEDGPDDALIATVGALLLYRAPVHVQAMLVHMGAAIAESAVAAMVPDDAAEFEG